MRDRHRDLRVARWAAVGTVLAAAAVFGAAARADDPPGRFEDVAEAAGVAAPHHVRAFANPYAEVMAGYTAIGAAAAVADFDGDGWEDLFVTDSAEGGRNHLYRNTTGETGRLSFTDVAEAAGVAAGNDAGNASADALFLDFNDDGRPDLFVVRFGESQLFENLGGGRFRDATAGSGLERYANALTAVAFDYDRDGDLDLAVGSYFRPVDVFHPSTPYFFPESFETAENGGGVTLWRNDGGGRFTDATRAAGIALSGWTLDLGHADFDGDGDPDLYVACDFGSDRLLVNDGDGTFTDRTAEAIGIDTKKGMNAEWGDFDGDGLLDVYVTNITDDYMREGNFLWRNNGDGTFTDVARETGTYDSGWGWGAKFLDYDDDGRLDLYAAAGWVSAGPDSFVPDIFAMIVRPGVDLTDARNWPRMGGKSLSGYQPNRLFHNRGGVFADVAPRLGVDSRRDGRGVAVADFDRDGRLDLFVANASGAPHLYRNALPLAAHWIGFALEGRESNRDAVGARLAATAGGRTQVREVDGGNGFAGQSSRRVHFGLAGVPALDRLEVRWPSGRRQVYGPLPADRVYRLVEGEPVAVAVPPPGSAVAAGTAAVPAGRSSALGSVSADARARAAQAPASEPAGTATAAPTAAHTPSAADEPARAAREQTAAGDDAAALPLFEAALDAAPDDLRAANDYRRAIRASGEYDRAIEFFDRLTADHPRSAHAWLNFGYAYVDKIPAAGSITQVILANRALGAFSEAIEIERSWLALYTRGNSYLYWPKIFGRAPLGVADLEEALALAEADPRPKRVYVRNWIALGDGYWRTDQVERARETWRRGLDRFPGDPELTARLAREGDALDEYLHEQLDPNRRVDTDLSPLWEGME